MPFTSSKDTQFGDCSFNISQTEKRLVRATLKTYERTGKNVFLKLFKKAARDYKFEQRISLTLEEFGKLVKKAESIRQSATRESPSKPPPAKKQKPDQSSKDGWSNVWALSQLFRSNSKAVQVFNCWRKAKSEICQLPTNHLHVLIESAIGVQTMKTIKIFTVPCLFTTLRQILSTSTSLESKGDTFSKLQLDVDFNYRSGDKIDSANVSKQLPPLATAATKLPKSTTVTSGISKTLAATTSIVPQKTIHNFVCSTISSRTQTDQFSSETFKREASILSGPHSGAFCQIMDIFMSDIGKLNIDSNLLFVRLVYEEKIQFF